METDNPQPEFHTFNYDDGHYKTLYTRKFENRQPFVPKDPKKIFAFIPGTVMKVFVKDKAKIRKGDPLLVLQAMKMNNIITSQINGVIKKVHVKHGELVSKTQILVEFK
jgi:biotin carboxyl carrier protein